MQIIREYHHCPGSLRGAVIALGNFDGLHRGHLAVLEQTRKLAEKKNAPAAVMTFHPHPREFFSGGGESLTLMPLPLKACLLARMHMDALFAQRFNRALSSLTAETFIQQVLGHHLQVSHVVTGEDFIFGKGRGGNTALLEAMGSSVGFGTTRVREQLENGERFSSTRIRASLAAGGIKDAARLLGRPHLIMGHVHTGDRRGRRLGFPTANVKLRNVFLPAFGIYAVRVLVDDQWHNGIANLGTRPMYGAPAPLLEAHVFNYTGNLYGKRIVTALVEYVRPEAIFDSEAQLMAQMQQDALHARTLLEKEPPMSLTP